MTDLAPALDNWVTHVATWVLALERLMRIAIWVAKRFGVKKVTVEIDIADALERRKP
jgi:hypothetical protein